MRKFPTIGAFWSLLLATYLAGCGSDEPAADQVEGGQTPPQAAETQTGGEQPSGQSARPSDGQPGQPQRLAQQPSRAGAASQPRDGQSATSERPGIRNALVRGLLDLLDQADDLEDEDRDELHDTLLEADGVLAQIKDENRHALKQVNRQVRSRNQKTPNIVLIVADDLGFGDLGCYGQTRIQTPNIDRMAAEGIRFTDYYAGSSVGSASRCSLMTGLHTGHARTRGDRVIPLAPRDVTIAEVLWLAGYSTGILGKWGLGDAGTTGTPNRQGFEYHFGYLTREHAADYYPDFFWQNESQFPIEANQDGARGQYSSDLLTERALAYLEFYRDRPFFLELAYTIPHATLDPPDDASYSGESWPAAMKNYAAMITRMDRDVGRILEKLDELDMTRKTIVFFTSDNGPHAEGGGDPGFFESAGGLRGQKAVLYEGGIRVPMIVRWSGRIDSGAVSDVPWAAWDMLPTLADLAGAWRIPNGLDGISIVPLLLSGDLPQREALYWELHNGRFLQAARDDQWKAVRQTPGGLLELYDLSEDAAESTNVAAQNLEVVERLEALMDEAHTDSPDWPVSRR